MLASRKREALEELAADIDGETFVFPAHAGKVDDARACIAATLEHFGSLDILVNNAATNPYYGRTLGVNESQFDKTFEVNLRGPLFWCQVAYQSWMKQHPGVILNIASVGGMRGVA